MLAKAILNDKVRVAIGRPKLLNENELLQNVAFITFQCQWKSALISFQMCIPIQMHLASYRLIIQNVINSFIMYSITFSHKILQKRMMRSKKLKKYHKES